jgi:hypothetical protein
MCPNLQKLNLVIFFYYGILSFFQIFRKEMNLRELVLLLLKIFEASSSHLEEVIFHIPSNIYQHPVRLFELTKMLPELLPLFAFSYLRCEDDQIKRGLRGVGKEFFWKILE